MILFAGAGVAIIGAIVFVLLTRGDPVRACIDDRTFDEITFAEALPDCFVAEVQAAETPGDAANAVRDGLVAIESVDAFGPLLINNWNALEGVIKERAIAASLTQVVPFMRNEVTAEVHRTGVDNTGNFVVVTYSASGNRSVTLRLDLGARGESFAVQRAQYASPGAG